MSASIHLTKTRIRLYYSMESSSRSESTFMSWSNVHKDLPYAMNVIRVDQIDVDIVVGASIGPYYRFDALLFHSSFLYGKINLVNFLS